jgi:hypothetical protein
MIIKNNFYFKFLRMNKKIYTSYLKNQIKQILYALYILGNS